MVVLTGKVCHAVVFYFMTTLAQGGTVATKTTGRTFLLQQHAP